MQAFAILPAAGRSQRMGDAKLLLPWRGTTVIAHVLATWRASQVAAVMVVVSPRDPELAEICRGAGVHVVQPRVQPTDMKASVRFGLEYLAKNLSPRPDDAWLLAPADMPLLQTATIDQVIAAARAADSQQRANCVFLPEQNGRRGHPALFPTSTLGEVFALRESEGIDALVRRHRQITVPVDDEGCTADLDTPDDYQRLRAGESR